MTTFYTADLHFGHRNIIKYCNRPWVAADGQFDTRAMTAGLIERINERVGEDDRLIVVGDVALNWKAVRIKALLDQLRCRNRILVRGNHDTFTGDAGFVEVYDELVLDDLYVVHQPPTELEWSAKKQENPQLKLCLCGHVHDAWARRGDIINVGVDVRDWYPRTREELIA